MATKIGKSLDAERFIEEWLDHSTDNSVEFGMKPTATMGKVVLTSNGEEWIIEDNDAAERVAELVKKLQDADDKRLVGINPGKALGRVRYYLRGAGVEAFGDKGTHKNATENTTTTSKKTAPVKEPTLAEKRENAAKALTYAKELAAKIPELEQAVKDIDLQIAAQAAEQLSKLSEQIAALEAQRAALAALVAPAVVPEDASI